MASSSSSLRPPPPATRIVCGHRRRLLGPNSLSPFPLRPAPSARVRPRSFVPVSATTTSSHSPWEREEARWLREEQRWLREEQRWMREESRWRAEREALLREVAALRLRVEALEGGLPSHLEAVVVEKSEERRIEAGELRPALVEEAQVKEMILEEAKVVGAEEEKKAVEKVIGRRMLRMGSEGDDVREMQEALQRLGFYSGEEDMEFASFSSGTERAVKTWQATVGTSQDGVMTTELLERLFMKQTTGDATSKDGSNGAAVASLTEVTEVQQKPRKDTGDADVKASHQRVFLLGENRWEEPSRLIGRNRPEEGSKAASTIKCTSCRGEGKLLCTECDGTGEPNIEPQFLEWVDEGMKCPYCEGLGYIICDACEGKAVVDA